MKERLQLRGEQRLAPCHGRPQGPVAIVDVTRPLRQCVERGAEPSADLLYREASRECRRELNCQRKAVDCGHYVAQGLGIGVIENEPGRRCGRTLQEQRPCGGALHGAETRTVGAFERVEWVLVL